MKYISRVIDLTFGYSQISGGNLLSYNKICWLEYYKIQLLLITGIGTDIYR